MMSLNSCVVSQNQTREKNVSISTEDKEKETMMIDMMQRFETRLKGLESLYKKSSGLTGLTSQNQIFKKTLSDGGSERRGLCDYMRHGDLGAYKSLSSADPRTGAVFIPSPTQDFVEQQMPEYSPLRKLARVSHITTDSLDLLIDKGGADVGWVSEVESRDETKSPELTKLTIQTHELYAKPRASQKLLDDIKVDLEQWLVSKVAWQMGLMENQAFIHGDGKGKPRGFLTYEIVDPGKGEWGKFESLSTGEEGEIHEGDPLVDLFHMMKPELLEGAVWMMPRSVLSMIRKLKDKQGSYLYNDGFIQGQAGTILGHPIVISDAMPAPSKGSFSLVFANFRHGYQIVERQDIQLLRDPYSAKPYIEFYATKRIGGDVVNFDAIKVMRFA